MLAPHPAAAAAGGAAVHESAGGSRGRASSPRGGVRPSRQRPQPGDARVLAGTGATADQRVAAARGRADGGHGGRSREIRGKRPHREQRCPRGPQGGGAPTHREAQARRLARGPWRCRRGYTDAPGERHRPVAGGAGHGDRGDCVRRRGKAPGRPVGPGEPSQRNSALSAPAARGSPAAAQAPGASNAPRSRWGARDRCGVGPQPGEQPQRLAPRACAPLGRHHRTDRRGGVDPRS